MKVKERLLAEEGYLSEKNMIKDVYLLSALAKIEQYRAECEFFEKKYGMSLRTFKQQLRRARNEEDFQKEEDLANWEFAANALKWWKRKQKELRVAAND